MPDKLVANPVLKGFNPDPSMIRVGDDYYIATSTFEWFPGVQISHSKDLRHWEVVARPLDRYSQLDMRGNPNSGGVWAPCLSYCDGTYYLIYSDAKHWTGAFKDVHNYLVTAPSIQGPWSDPIYLNSSGFDPSLFHDDDGRKWLLNMIWDHRPEHHSFSGIALQEYDPLQKKLVGEIKNIFKGTDLALVEGPHLYKRNGFYYLLTAEGGTFLTHAETVARANSIDGPYQVMPQNPLITSIHESSLALKSAGHGCLVENADGTWLFAHLCRRPLKNGRSILGRETSIQNIEWVEDWPRLPSGKVEPDDHFSSPISSEPLEEGRRIHYDFSKAPLSIDWQAPRIPIQQFTSQTERPGFLRVHGQESITSKFEQSLLARRQQAFHITVSTCMEYQPSNIQQMAGLVAFYNTDAFYYLYVTHAEHADTCLGLMRCDKGQVSHLIEKEYALQNGREIYLKMEIILDKIQFYYSSDGQAWTAAGWTYDASILADEYAVPCGFTGNFVGLACHDTSGQKRYADFKWFEYQEHASKPE